MGGLAVLLLAAACVAGLVLVPLGLPGLWVMVLGVIGDGWLTDFATVGVGTIALVLALAMAGELIEAWPGGAGVRCSVGRSARPPRWPWGW